MERIYLRAITLLAFFFLLQSSSKAPGGDYYSIHLNDKKMVEQFLTMPQKNHTLALPSAGENDRLVIRYTHCGAAGQDRSVTMRSNSGKILKQWNFKSGGAGMQIKLKELTDALGKTGSAALYYSSKELTEGKQLVSLYKAGSTAKL